MNCKTLKIKIQNGQERENVVIALANEGRQVWVEVVEVQNGYRKDYFVCFLVDEEVELK